MFAATPIDNLTVRLGIISPMTDRQPKPDPPTAAQLSEIGRLLRSIPSPRRTEASRANGQSGGRPVKPLDDIACTCAAGPDTLEGHRAYCPRGRAIKRRGLLPVLILCFLCFPLLPGCSRPPAAAPVAVVIPTPAPAVVAPAPLAPVILDARNQPPFDTAKSASPDTVSPPAAAPSERDQAMATHDNYTASRETLHQQEQDCRTLMSDPATTAAQREILWQRLLALNRRDESLASQQWHSLDGLRQQQADHEAAQNPPPPTSANPDGSDNIFTSEPQAPIQPYSPSSPN